MRSGISFTVSASGRQRLRAIVADPKSPQKHAWRARIVLLSGAGLGTSAIMAETDKSKTCVWRWQPPVHRIPERLSLTAKASHRVVRPIAEAH